MLSILTVAAGVALGAWAGSKPSGWRWDLLALVGLAIAAYGLGLAWAGS